MLGVAGSFSILLPEPPSSSYSSMLASPRRGGKSLEVGPMAGRAANLHIIHHHFLHAYRQTSSSAVDQGLI